MNNTLATLSDTDLRALITALRSKRIATPYSEFQIAHVLPATVARSVASALGRFDAMSFQAEQLVAVLELLEQDRIATRSAQAAIDLVASGPEAAGIANRDTAVVVRELFARAERSVLIVGYAVHQGLRVFEALASRMEEKLDLEVEMFLDIPRPNGDVSPAAVLVSRFAQRFRGSQWPQGYRLPRVYYDPRSVDSANPIRSSLHAKCIVVDDRQVFVSSANFTEAGQQRNIEVGLIVNSVWLADRLTQHFKRLYAEGLVARAF